MKTLNLLISLALMVGLISGCVASVSYYDPYVYDPYFYDPYLYFDPLFYW